MPVLNSLLKGISQELGKNPDRIVVQKITHFPIVIGEVVNKDIRLKTRQQILDRRTAFMQMHTGIIIIMFDVILQLN